MNNPAQYFIDSNWEIVVDKLELWELILGDSSGAQTKIYLATANKQPESALEMFREFYSKLKPSVFQTVRSVSHLGQVNTRIR